MRNVYHLPLKQFLFMYNIYLIKSASEESGKSGNKWNCTTTATSSNSNRDKILLGNKAFDVTIRRNLKQKNQILTFLNDKIIFKTIKLTFLIFSE